MEDTEEYIIPHGVDEEEDGVSFDAASELYRTFVTSSVQKLAYDTIRDDILHMDMWWVAQTKRKVLRKKIEISHWQHALWKNFIEDLLLQVCLYGFALYRLVQIEVKPDTPGSRGVKDPRDTSEQTASGEGDQRSKAPKVKSDDKSPELTSWHLEVAKGDCVALTWDPKLRKWIPSSVDGTNFDSREGWNIVYESMPYRVGPNSFPLYSSVCATAYKDVCMLNRMVDNMMRRDNTNTTPSVWTTIDKRFGPLLPSSVKPSFQPSMHDAMLTVPRHTEMDFDTMLGNHVEALEKLQAVSKDLASSAYGGRPVGAALKRPTKRPKKHHEYALSQAHEGRELQYRRGPEDFSSMYDRLINNILFSWHVPPQVLGKNINSERLASSNRLSEAALHRYSRFIDTLRGIVSLAVKTLSREISKSNQFYVSMYPCINEYTVSKIESVVKPDVARNLLSCVYGVPQEYFDIEKIKTRQEVLMQGQGASTSQPARKERPLESEEKKLERKRKKAITPSDQ